MESYRAKMEKAQRKIASRVASAYKTVSLREEQVLSGITPIHLLKEERRYIHQTGTGRLEEARGDAREITMRVWQQVLDENHQT